MPIDVNTLLVWTIIGGCLWLVGRVGHNISKPKHEISERIEAANAKLFVKVPNWVKVLCGISSNSEHLQWQDLSLQLTGILAIAWGLVAGLSAYSPVAPFLTLLGIGTCILVPSLLVRYWQRDR